MTPEYAGPEVIGFSRFCPLCGRMLPPFRYRDAVCWDWRSICPCGLVFTVKRGDQDPNRESWQKGPVPK